MSAEHDSQAMSSEEFAQVLNSWKLSQYIKTFEEQGWDDPADWSELVLNKGKNLAAHRLIVKPGHRSKFIRNFKNSKWYEKPEEKVEQKDMGDRREDAILREKPLSFAKKQLNAEGFYIIPSVVDDGLDQNAHWNCKISSTERHKVILMVGQTGAGKTTTINSMVNYMYKVKYGNLFRYKIINEKEKDKGQTESQTDTLISYYLKNKRRKTCENDCLKTVISKQEERKADDEKEHHVDDKDDCGPCEFENNTVLNYDLTIVDTPGFGDTRGVKRDIKIMTNIKMWFKKRLDTLDAICFVIKATDVRLTTSQKYIFEQILSIFGKDVKNNVFVLITSCDGSEPKAIEALKEAKIEFVKSFKLNNCVYFKDPINKRDKDERVDKFYWDIGNESFKDFFNTLNKTNPVSLQLTNDVLRLRAKLKIEISRLNGHIERALDYMAHREKLKQFLQENEAKINRGEAVIFTGKTVKIGKIESKNFWDLRHVVCNNSKCKNKEYDRACHISCWSPLARLCCMMNEENTCDHCGCSVHYHQKQSFYYGLKEYETETSQWNLQPTAAIKTVEAKLTTAQTEIGHCNDWILRMQSFVAETIVDVTMFTNQLEKIALNTNVSSTKDHIDEMIQMELVSKKDGYLNRVTALRNIAAQTETIEQIKNKQFDFKQTIAKRQQRSIEFPHAD